MKRAKDPHSVPPYLRPPYERRYWIYILASKNRQTIYIGVTDDLSRRLRVHRNPAAESTAFATVYHTVALVYYEAFDCIDIAIAREKQLKGWRRAKKNALISNMNSLWEDLSVKFERAWPVVENME